MSNNWTKDLRFLSNMANVIGPGRGWACQQRRSRLPKLGSSLNTTFAWLELYNTDHSFCKHRSQRGEIGASRPGDRRAEPGSRPSWGQPYSLHCDISHCFHLFTTYYSCILNNYIQWLAVSLTPCDSNGGPWTSCISITRELSSAESQPPFQNPNLHQINIPRFLHTQQVWAALS